MQVEAMLRSGHTHAGETRRFPLVKKRDVGFVDGDACILWIVSSSVRTQHAGGGREKSTVMCAWFMWSSAHSQHAQNEKK